MALTDRVGRGEASGARVGGVSQGPEEGESARPAGGGGLILGRGSGQDRTCGVPWEGAGVRHTRPRTAWEERDFHYKRVKKPWVRLMQEFM